MSLPSQGQAKRRTRSCAAFQNAKTNTPHTAHLAHDQALGKAAQGSMKDFTQFYKQFVENESFKRFVADRVYAITSPG
jgi:type I restriction enzyme R subunit